MNEVGLITQSHAILISILCNAKHVNMYMCLNICYYHKWEELFVCKIICHYL